MKNFLIIGNSAAGIAAAEGIRAKNRTDKITIISDEDAPCYSRCLISYYLAGDMKESGMLYRNEDFFKENNIQLLLNRKAISIKPKKNTVVIEEEQDDSIKKVNLEYDYLILANGASAKMLDIKGIQKKGVFGFRTIEDARNISTLVPISTTACVLGGGLIGLKAAYGLKKRNLEVKVLIRSPQVLSQVLDKQSADMFQERIQEKGIEIVTGMGVSEVLGNGDVKAVKLDSGKVIGCSIVVVGKGVAPNIDLVADSGIETTEGIIVNENMRTNIENIFAAGDVCETYDPALDKRVVNALWPNAVEQGRVAGANVCGDNLKYDGSMGMNSVEFFDLPVISMGITKPKADSGCEELVRKSEGVYKKLVVKDNRLVGMIALGKLEQSGVYLKLIKEKIDVSNILDDLLSVNFSYAKVFDLIGKEDSIYV